MAMSTTATLTTAMPLEGERAARVLVEASWVDPLE